MAGVKGLAALGRHVAEDQDAWLARTSLAEVRSRLARLDPGARRAARPVQLARWATAAALALGVVTVVALMVLRSATAPLSFTVAGEPGKVGAWVSAPANGTLALDFSDGSRIELEAAARARVVDVGRHGAHLVLESGRLRATVEKRPGSSWSVSSGPFQVHVIGTRFDVTWTPNEDLFVLALHEGRVNVSGCVFGADGRPVLAGETLRAWCDGGRFEVAQGGDELAPRRAALPDATGSDPATRPPPAAIRGASDATASASDAGAPEEEADWRALLRAGRHKDAVIAAEATGFDAACASATVEELAALADALRFAGRLDRATVAYETLRQRFPGTNHAATAAFTLGRLASDSQSNYARAAVWFETYLRERPGGALAREALGRLMEASYRSGNTAGAKQLAVRYLEVYPKGPHARLAGQLVEPREAKKRTRKKR